MPIRKARSPRHSNDAAQQEAARMIAENLMELPSDGAESLACVKDQSRQQLVLLLDHLDRLPERERLAVLVALHKSFQVEMSAIISHLAANLELPLARSPRAEAYAAGRLASVFRDSFFGG